VWCMGVSGEWDDHPVSTEDIFNMASIANGHDGGDKETAPADTCHCNCHKNTEQQCQCGGGGPSRPEASRVKWSGSVHICNYRDHQYYQGDCKECEEKCGTSRAAGDQDSKRLRAVWLPNMAT
jgi:hypothetical protein